MPNSPFSVCGINRKILECKFQKTLLLLLQLPVLIETYWNVNVRDIALMDSAGEY